MNNRKRAGQERLTEEFNLGTDADAGRPGSEGRGRCRRRAVRLRPGMPEIEVVVVNPRPRMSDAAIDWLIEMSHQALKADRKKEEETTS